MAAMTRGVVVADDAVCPPPYFSRKSKSQPLSAWVTWSR
jgi:hypothetical protein